MGNMNGYMYNREHRERLEGKINTENNIQNNPILPPIWKTKNNTYSAENELKIIIELELKNNNYNYDLVYDKYVENLRKTYNKRDLNLLLYKIYLLKTEFKKEE